MTGDSVSNQKHLPDPAVCRTRYLGNYLPFSSCLVEKPESCKYTLRCGDAFLCTHPDRRKFEKTSLS
jgi:hypothetical protein